MKKLAKEMEKRGVPVLVSPDTRPGISPLHRITSPPPAGHRCLAVVCALLGILFFFGAAAGVSADILEAGGRESEDSRAIAAPVEGAVPGEPDLHQPPVVIPWDDELTASGETVEKRECTQQEGPLLPDRGGLARDSLYFVGYQVFAVGVLYVLPEDITHWSDEQKDEYDLDRWTKNVRNPVWDGDKWYVNYLLHPYWGSAYYTRARERGFDVFQSFLYSAFLSGLYEFSVEAFFEPPSYQDLIVTPVAGSILGMAFEPVREKIKAKGTDQVWYDKAFLVLTDPLGAANSLLDRLFGIKGSVSIKREGAKSCAKADSSSLAGYSDDMIGQCRRTYNGLELTLSW